VTPSAGVRQRSEVDVPDAATVSRGAQSYSSARSRSIWLWQLSLAAGVVTIAAIGSIIMPQMYASPLFVVGILAIIALTLACLAIPWQRVPPWGVALVPLADIVAIGLMGYGGVFRLNYLWIFPVAWIATFYSLRWLITAMGTVAVVLAIDILTTYGVPLATQRLVVIVLSLSFLGIVIHSVSQHARALRRVLRKHASRLQAALTRSHAQAERTKQMFDSLDVAVARISDAGEILAANESFIELFALEPEDLSLPGRSVEYDAEWGEPIPAEQRPLARAARRELTDGERAWLYDPDGRWHVVSISTRPLPPAQDGTSTVLIVQDVSELHRVEQERRAIIAAVSHELRNPLTAVLGRTELLLDRGDLPPRAREQIAVIDQAGERMLQLVIDNLAQAQSESTTQAELTHVDLARVLTASVESFIPAAAVAGVEITLEADSPLLCAADAFRLRQVFDNLLTNAVKYTPPDGAISVTATADNTAICISVADTGVGIEPDDLPRIFEPYFRGQIARESGIHGTGIGMGIVRDIVEEHGGTIAVHSQPGAGTNVTVRLPRLTADQEDRCSAPA
jgi:two-component system phosphate regulon sensor histidine kinase PhoR